MSDRPRRRVVPWERRRLAGILCAFQALFRSLENSSGRGESSENSSGRGGRGEEARGAETRRLPAKRYCWCSLVLFFSRSIRWVLDRVQSVANYPIFPDLSSGGVKRSETRQARIFREKLSITA